MKLHFIHNMKNRKAVFQGLLKKMISGNGVHPPAATEFESDPLVLLGLDYYTLRNSTLRMCKFMMNVKW